ncbi:MAG: VanW family protein [Firmicutes bacterium]|nr:VanW family protein [Bacillota bacterium]
MSKMRGSETLALSMTGEGLQTLSRGPSLPWGLSLVLTLLAWTIGSGGGQSSSAPPGKSGGFPFAWASFSTELRPEQRNRNHNVALVAKSLDGRRIKPGELLSFNSTVGPRTAARGYLRAKELVAGEEAPGVGGGTCQVSSTLYNTALLAGLAIVERWPHSQVVPYVPAGRDATVTDGGRDLKFKNTSGEELLLRAGVEGARLVIGLYGRRAPMKQVYITTEVVELLEPRMILGPSPGAAVAAGGTGRGGLAPERHIRPGRTGRRVLVWRVSTDPSGLSERELIGESVYPAGATVVH